MSATTPSATTVFPEFLHAIADAYGSDLAVRLDEETLSYAELEERSRKRALGLLQRGVGKGSRIGLVLSNGPDWAVNFSAIVRIGATAVPLSTFFKAPELARVIHHADLHGLIIQHEFLGQDFVATTEKALPGLVGSDVTLALTEAPYLRFIVVTGDASPTWAHSMTWLEDSIDTPQWNEILTEAERQVFLEDPALIIYTSGQSAMPKGVIHSHATLVGKTHFLVEMFQPQRGEAAPAMMPLFWVGGLALHLMSTLEVGGIVECSHGGTSGGVIMGIKQPIRLMPSGVASGLGMSESFASYSFGTEDPHEEHPLCLPMTSFDPQIEVKVVTEDGRIAQEGERGEICIRGRGVTIGLQKILQADAFDADGFYRTGDEALVHGDGHCFVGRLGDMIKAAGANVSPAEVEVELLEFEEITNAHVVAVTVPERGDVVGAAVVRKEGATLDEATIVAQLKERLSTYKVPRLIAFIGLDEIPLTPSAKVDKRMLSALIAERAHGEAR